MLVWQIKFDKRSLQTQKRGFTSCEVLFLFQYQSLGIL